MRLLVTIGYTDILFGATSDYALLLKSLEGAATVTHDYKTNAYTVQSRADSFVFKLIPDGDVSLPDTALPDAVEKFRKTSAEATELQLEVYRLRAELDKAKSESAKIKSAVEAV